MPRRDPQKAIQVLDTMLEFFDSGRKWTGGTLCDQYGERRCLIGALRHVASLSFRAGDAAAFLRPRRNLYPFLYRFTAFVVSGTKARVRTRAYSQHDRGSQVR